MTQQQTSSASMKPQLPAAAAPPIRSDLIATAIRFLQDVQVEHAPLSKKIAFLESKGLRAEEIDLALLKASNSGVEKATGSDASSFARQDQRQGRATNTAILATIAAVGAAATLVALNYPTVKKRALDLWTRFKAALGDHEQTPSRVDRIEEKQSQMQVQLTELKDSLEARERYIMAELKALADKLDEV